jgi:hypothetical protein
MGSMNMMHFHPPNPPIGGHQTVPEDIEYEIDAFFMNEVNNGLFDNIISGDKDDTNQNQTHESEGERGGEMQYDRQSDNAYGIEKSTSGYLTITDFSPSIDTSPSGGTKVLIVLGADLTPAQRRQQLFVQFVPSTEGGFSSGAHCSAVVSAEVLTSTVLRCNTPQGGGKSFGSEGQGLGLLPGR